MVACLDNMVIARNLVGPVKAQSPPPKVIDKH